MDSEMKSTAKWDGDVLVIDSKMDMQGNAITITNRWTLSGDGKGLTVAMHFASPMGEGDIKMATRRSSSDGGKRSHGIIVFSPP